MHTYIYIYMHTQQRRIPLHHAAFRGHMEVVRLLLDNKADTSYTNADGHTAWQIAVQVRLYAVLIC